MTSGPGPRYWDYRLMGQLRMTPIRRALAQIALARVPLVESRARLVHVSPIRSRQPHVAPDRQSYSGLERKPFLEELW